MQLAYSPINYGFEWTDDWYKFDAKAARSAAIRARNAEAKKYQFLGYPVTKWTAKDQRVSKGGIGSGKPHIELVMSVYYLEVN